MQQLPLGRDTPMSSQTPVETPFRVWYRIEASRGEAQHPGRDVEETERVAS